MGAGIYYIYHGFGLKAFEGHHIRIKNKLYLRVDDHSHWVWTVRKHCNGLKWELK